MVHVTILEIKAPFGLRETVQLASFDLAACFPVESRTGYIVILVGIETLKVLKNMLHLKVL